jgi:mono/diheme cytochrome c family protein
MKKAMLRVGIVVVAVAALGTLAYRYWRTRNLGAVQRGYAVAEAKGCFACHGPGGMGVMGQGMPNPGHDFGEVPTWSREVRAQYATSEAEIREWILDGTTARFRNDPEQKRIRARAIVPMPAFRGKLSTRQLDEVVAYVKAVSELECPPEGAAARGREAAVKYGCFGCHGAQGRGAPSNVGAFKGYIPSWDGADFPALAQDDAEIREWILDGAAQRLANHPVAGRFVRGQQIQMPKYRGFIADAEVEDLIAYIHWVREHRY